MTETQNFTLSSIDTSQGRMYCGPTVLAMLTGKTRAEIHADVNRLKRMAGARRRKRKYSRDGFPIGIRLLPWSLTASVKGMSNLELEKLMKKYKLSHERHNTSYPSLRQLVADMGHFTMPIVINVTGHYVLYFRGEVYDTYRPCGCAVAEHPSGRSRVQKYWLIKKQRATLTKIAGEIS